MPEDLFKMRQDAIRRAKEVYSRSSNQPQAKPPASNQSPPQAQSSPPPQNFPQASPGLLSGNPTDIISSIFKDKDKTLILSLLLLLAEEKQDNELLFTLIYLLM